MMVVTTQELQPSPGTYVTYNNWTFTTLQRSSNKAAPRVLVATLMQARPPPAPGYRQGGLQHLVATHVSCCPLKRKRIGERSMMK